MDVKSYIDRIEQVVADPVALTAIREEAVADKSLPVRDREFISERVGNYLADHERTRGPDSEDLEPMEGGDAGL